MAEIREEGTIIKFIYGEGKAPVESITVTDVNTNIEFAAVEADISLVDGGHVVIPTKYKVGDVRVDVKYSQEEYVIEGVAVSCEEPAYIASIKSIGYYSFVLDLSDCNKQTTNCTINGNLRSDASDIPLSLRLLKTPSGKLIKTKDGRLRCVHYEIDAGLPSGRKCSLRELQKKNPIQVGSYLGLIYWDGKGIYVAKGAIFTTNGSLLIDNQGRLALQNGGDITVLGTEAGYYAIDASVTSIEENAFFSVSIGAHIAALELHKPVVGDVITRFYWDGVSEKDEIHYIDRPANVQLYTTYKTKQKLNVYDGNSDKNYDMEGAQWSSVEKMTGRAYVKISVVEIAYVPAGTATKSCIWIPGLPSTNSVQSVVDESRPVAMAIDNNGTPIVTKVASTK